MTNSEAQNKITQIVKNGYIVADSRGNEWITLDVNNSDEFIFLNNKAERCDWDLQEDETIRQEYLDVPDECGGIDHLLCRYQKNNQVLSPLDETDLEILEISYNSFIIVRSSNNY